MQAVSWQVEGLTLTLLRQITSLGYTVSVHRIPSPLLGGSGAYVEMHATDLRVDPPRQHIARAREDDDGDTDCRCSCVLAEVVGIQAEEG